MASKMEIPANLTRTALAATAALLLLSGNAVAQLALPGNMPVPETGIPFGATGLDSPGLSPALTGNGTACSAIGSSSSGVPGSSSIYDGGGIGMGTSSLLASQTCGATSGNAVSSAATPASPPPSSGSISRAGIPLGSFEINNAGISPPVAVPLPGLPIATTNSLSSAMIGASKPCPIPGSSTASTAC
jgi:hypothetical protein